MLDKKDETCSEALEGLVEGIELGFEPRITRITLINFLFWHLGFVTPLSFVVPRSRGTK